MSFHECGYSLLFHHSMKLSILVYYCCSVGAVWHISPTDLDQAPSIRLFGLLHADQAPSIRLFGLLHADQAPSIRLFGLLHADQAPSIRLFGLLHADQAPSIRLFGLLHADQAPSIRYCSVSTGQCQMLSINRQRCLLINVWFNPEPELSEAKWGVGEGA